MAKKTGKLPTIEDKPIIPEAQDEFEEMLYARHVEVETFKDLEGMRGTPIPALFNQYYPFVQNPSTISVDTFKRMVDTDDTIGSGVDFLVSCLAARMGRYQHEDEEITKFVNDAIGKVEGGFHNSLKEMLSSTWAGFSVSEMQWKDDPDFGFFVRRFITMPPMTLLFEMTRSGELTEDGILQYQKNWNPLIQGSGFGYSSAALGSGLGMPGFGGKNDALGRLGDMPFPLRSPNPFNLLCLRIPKQKCVHMSFDAQGKFGSPYGRSLLRRIYKYYVIKDALLQMLVVALNRKGTPLTLVYADPNTTLESPKRNPTGANPKGMRGRGTRADAAARDAFKNVNNDSVIFLPGKKGEIYEVDKLDVQANASDFISALDFCNKSILRGLLVPSLIFGNGDGTGSYSLGQEHAKTFDKILDSMLVGAKSELINSYVKPLIAYNFPEAKWKGKDMGDFSKRTLSAEEIQKEADTYEKGVNIGVIDAMDLGDLNKMRDTMGFEPRKTPIEKPVTIFEEDEEGAYAPEDTFAEGEDSKNPEKKGGPKAKFWKGWKK